MKLVHLNTDGMQLPIKEAPENGPEFCSPFLKLM